MPLDVVQTLCDLVRLPSVNPMGHDVTGDEYYEYRVTAYLQDVFERLGIPWQRQPIAPKQDNIVARLDGDLSPDEGGQILMLEVHQDTVPVGGMTIPPWTPEIRDGRVFGRGSCDVKGGMACILAALSRLVEDRPPGLPTIVMACSINEEYGFAGASQMPELWKNGNEGLIPRAPDAVIVTEPTELDVVVAHKGVLRWRCHTHGHAAHSSQPEMGENAIYRMSRVVTALEKYARDVVPHVGRHPLVGSPALSVGVISGGTSVNIVPDRCTIEVERRVLPGEDPAEAWEHVKSYLGTEVDQQCALEHDEPHQMTYGLEDDLNASLAASLSETTRQHGHSGRCLGVPYGTDAPVFWSAGIPAVVFGPGSISQAHQADEWIAIDQLHAATEVFYEFALTYGRTGEWSSE